MHEPLDELFSQLKATWRYRWYAVAIAWVIAVGGWIAVHLIPDRYEATARVYVDTQSVLRPLLSGLAVQPNIDQTVMMMSRTLISGPNLEKVIQMVGMDVDLKTSENREKLISHLAKEITIKSTGRENLYTISYGAKNPQEAKQVVQALVELFMGESLVDKRKDSESARRFIEDQLKSYSEKLVAAENAVAEFKRRHMELMPGQGAGYHARLVETKSALNQALLDLKEAEDGRDSIKKQLADSETSSNPEIDARIVTLEQKLDGLRLNYTEEHPDIVATVRIIAQLEEQKKAEAKAGKRSRGTSQAQDTVYQQLIAAEANVAAMKARAAEYRRRLSELQAAANAAPQVEAEYTQLTRDYEVNKARYEKLLERRESAQISGDMEANAGAMGFRVVDPPQVPLTPNAPNRLRLMSLVLLVALGGGLGVAFLIGRMRPTFNDERRLREVSGLHVLGTVVIAWTDAQKARRRRDLLALAVSFLSLLSAYAAIMATLVLTASRA